MADAINNAVDIATVAGSVAAHNMSVWGLVAQADIVVKFVMLILLISSLLSWSIIFDKWNFFRNVKYRTSRFEKAYRSSRTLGALYERLNKKNAENPMAEMFVAGMAEAKNGSVTLSEELFGAFKENIYYAVHRVKNETIDKMEKNLIFLATVGSAAPFLGLFGTVWGIVNSFQAIAATKNTTLAVVAPGIAEALLATAIGLFAALPAVVAYNFFSNQIRQMSGKLEDFGAELSSVLAHRVNE